MIARLRGTVVDRGPGRVVLDVNGVGYLVHVPAGMHVPSVGRVLELHTSLQVREDSMTLYGFVDAASLELFELLLGSSGVGPRLALAALATHPAAVLAAAIAAGDTATLVAVPGVGRKLAERMVLELADRVPAASGGSAVPPAGEDERLATVRTALDGFGFSGTEVSGVLATLAPEPDEDDATLLRRALRALDGAKLTVGAESPRTAPSLR
ncbi:MAG: Holliday junction branch migration protein RuvA [Actinomycetota bacterium]